MSSNPFQIAERYIQLRDKCMSPSWGDTVILFNEMVLGPFITIFLVVLGSTDYFMFVSAIMRAYTAWCDWEEYHVLKGQLQDMFLVMTVNGGPQIRTNDPRYLPYVIADSVFRLNERRQDPSGHRQPEQGKPKQVRFRPSHPK